MGIQWPEPEYRGLQWHANQMKPKTYGHWLLVGNIYGSTNLWRNMKTGETVLQEHPPEEK